MLEGLCQNIKQIDFEPFRHRGYYIIQFQDYFKCSNIGLRKNTIFNNKSKLKFVAFDGLILLLN